MTPLVSLLMLTHNAPEYVERSIRSVRDRTAAVDFELVVVDNASQPPTRQLVDELHRAGLIDRLLLSDRNTLFAEGNNVAARMANPDATHFLLLNSDIEVLRADWLAVLLSQHRRGVSSYGAAMGQPPRADGWCLLVDADLYRNYGGLDEAHQWWWSVTKLQATLLRDGYSVRAFHNPSLYIHHFGGKSGDDHRDALGMDVGPDQVAEWFAGTRPEVIDIDQREISQIAR